MFTNRISAYYSSDVEGTSGAPNPIPGSPEKDFRVPEGFSQLPSYFVAGMKNPQDLYREAYEQAKRDARQRLLDLLRSRQNGTGIHPV